MEDMLSKIIEMDEKASSLTANAQREKAISEQDIIKAKETIYNDYIERARKRISINEKAEIEAARIKSIELKEKHAQTLKELDDSYAKNKEQWVSSIVKNVISS